MALSLDTLSPPDTNVAACQRPEPATAAGKSPRHADPVAAALVEGARSASLSSRRLQDSPWLARLFVFGGGLAADRLRRLRDVPGRVGQPHDRAAVGLARPLHDQLLVDRRRFHERAPRLPRASRRGHSRAALPRRSASRTAIVMPVYNEQTARTFAALEAIRESVDATGLGDAISITSSSRIRPSPTPGSPRSAPSLTLRSGSARTRASITATGRRTTTARPATSPISSRRWGGHYEHMSCSTPTA